MQYIPKVLVACPTSSRHKHLLDEWVESLNSLTYPNFEVCLVDTSQDNGEYFKELQKIKIGDKKVRVFRKPWDDKKRHILQHLADCRNWIREYFLKGSFSHLFFLDSDIMFTNTPKNIIQRLLSHNKDCVGYYVPIYEKPNQKPCVFKSGNLICGKGLDLFSWDEMKAYEDFVNRFRDNRLTESEKDLSKFIIQDIHKPYLLKVYAVGIGCCIINKEVLVNVPFRTHDKIILGEDIWFFSECEDKGFEFWVDTDIHPDHKHTDWKLINEKCKGNVMKVIRQVEHVPQKRT